MNVMESIAQPRPTGNSVALDRRGAIDCDVHPALPSMSALLPYLDDYWREQVVTRGIDGMDMNFFPHAVAANCRPDWRLEDGKPGSSLAHLQSHLLDPFGIRYAICNSLYGVHAVVNTEMASAFCSALNEWMAREWLDRDPRLRASIMVAPHAPDLAAEEIEKRAGDKRFVQVLLFAMGEVPLGRRLHWPIFAAAEKHRMPVAIHSGTIYRHPLSWNGSPSYYMEDQFMQAHGAAAQVLSLLAGGVFKKFPALKVVLTETGFTWLPEFMWGAHRMWRAMRNEIPWVDRAPLEILREHIRVTLQPTDAPPTPEDMTKVLEMLGSDRMVLFSSDYPHWHFDGDKALPAGIPEPMLPKILVDNALETYPRLGGN